MRFLATKAGTAHVATLPDSICPVVRKNITTEWKGRRSLSPEAVLEMKDCSKCDTHKVAKAEIRKNRVAAKKAAAAPAKKRTSARRSDGFLNLATGELKVGPAPKSERLRHDGRTQKVALKKEPKAPTKATSMKSGSKFAWDESDKGHRLAKEHAELAEQHGWEVSVEFPSAGAVVLTAAKGDEKCILAYKNGSLDNDKIVAVFPGRTAALRNSGGWRRQISLPEGQRPVSREVKRTGRARSIRQPEDHKAPESESAPAVNGVVKTGTSKLPFDKDSPDIEIIDSLKGRTLVWRNNMAGTINEATLPAKTKTIRMGLHEKTGRRFVSFPESHGYDAQSHGEVLGAERSVALDQMIRVK